MPRLEFVTIAEKNAWTSMKTLLKERSSWRFRKAYYPNRMDILEEENQAIYQKCREEIMQLNKERHVKEEWPDRSSRGPIRLATMPLKPKRSREVLSDIPTRSSRRIRNLTPM